MFFAYGAITFGVLAMVCCCCINNVSRRRGRYFIGFTVFFMLLAFLMAFCLHNLPIAEYKEPELIYEVRMTDDEFEEIFEADTGILEFENINYYNDEHYCELGIEISNVRFVDSDLESGFIFQIYKIDSENSIWRLTRETKYDCVIQY